MTKLTDSEYLNVLHRIKLGHRHLAYETLYTEHQGLVYTVLSKYIRDEETRQDLKQEVFLDLWRMIHDRKKLPDAAGKFSAYIYSMAKFKAWEHQIKLWRDAVVRAMPLENHEDLDIYGEGDLDTPEQHAIVSQIIAVDGEANDGDIEAFKLVEVQGITPAQAAKELDCSTNAIYQRIHRVKERIRKGMYREVQGL